MSSPDTTPEAPANHFVVQGIDRVLTVQRPVVLAHLRSIRQRNPNASPEQVIRILERRYLTAVTTGGALVGASAVIPAVGVGASLALSGVETAAFLETSALFAQSVTEVHGIVVDDPDRARALVMTLVLGTAGSDLVKQLAGQAAGVGPGKTAFWGELVTKNLPRATVGRIADQVKTTFLRRFAVTQGTSAIGRAIPFGIGAVVGGAGNNLLGRQIINGARTAFPPPPPTFPDILDPRIRVIKAKAKRIPRLKHPKALMSGVSPVTTPESTDDAGAEAAPHDED
jgi:hypothetical protein